jgi:hypothetical protein
MTQILMIYFVSFVAPEGADVGTADRQRKTQTILKAVPLSVPVKGHARTQILILYIVSFVAPEEAEAGTADRHGMKQIISKFVPLCACTRDTQ